MGTVIPFSAAENYIKELSAKSKMAILDTNILIAASYEIKDSHEQTVDLLKRIETLGVKFFATVTTKSEFMEFHRRLLLTEILIDLVDGHSRVKVPSSAAEEIRKSIASVRSKQKRDRSDPIFNEAQLKAIKSEFSAGSHSGHLGWLKLCDTFLKGYIAEIESELEGRGIIYLSPNDPKQNELFTKMPEWQTAAALVEKTGLPVSDAMILNALNCSICDFAISMDFDFGFATLADPSAKNVIMPDKIECEYRHYHFNNL